MFYRYRIRWRLLNVWFGKRKIKAECLKRVRSGLFVVTNVHVRYVSLAELRQVPLSSVSNYPSTIFFHCPKPVIRQIRQTSPSPTRQSGRSLCRSAARPMRTLAIFGKGCQLRLLEFPLLQWIHPSRQKSV
jgi:hypothetical protein